MSELIVIQQDKDFLVVASLPQGDEVVDGVRYTFGTEKGGVVITDGGTTRFRKSRGPRYDKDLHALYAAHYGLPDPTLGGSTDSEGSSSTQVNAPIEHHSTGGPERPAGEEGPVDMTGGGKPIRGGGLPGGATSNPKGDDDSDGVKNRNDRFPTDPSRS